MSEEQPLEGQFRVTVYYTTETQKNQALDALRAVAPDNVYEYEGMIDGWATADVADALENEGLAVIRLPNTTSSSNQTAHLTPFDVRSKRQDPQLTSAAEVLRQYADPAEEARRWEGTSSLPKSDQDIIYKIRFKQLLMPDWREAVERLGTLKEYKPPLLYLIRTDSGNAETLRQLPYVADFKRFDSIIDTATVDLLEYIAQTANGFALSSAGGAQTFDLVLSTQPDAKAKMRKKLEEKGAAIVAESPNVIRFQLSGRGDDLRQVLGELAGMPEALSLTISSSYKLTCDRVRVIINADKVGLPVPGGALDELTGQGEIVAVFDSGIDGSHPDLKDRIAGTPVAAIAPGNVKEIEAIDGIGHGTHVAGIIAGTGASSKGCVRGIAPDAKLVVVRVMDTTTLHEKLNIEAFVDLGDLLQIGVDRNAKILNLSWAEGNFEYDHAAASIDKFVFRNPEVLVVVASGNQGGWVNGGIDFKKIGAPANAKNVVTVGASCSDRATTPPRMWSKYYPSPFATPPAFEKAISGNPDDPAPSNSRGPTYYDSIKPDILAPGTFILSARTSTLKKPNIYYDDDDDDKTPAGYGYLTGSSMAAPVISGVAAIIRQYLRLKDTPSPSAALVKAILVAAAKPLPNGLPNPLSDQIGYPDFVEGFGRIDLARVLPTKGGPQRPIVWIDVPNGNSALGLVSRAPIGSSKKSLRTFHLDVSGGTPLRIVLCWTDLPGKGPQNNLYIQVWGPAGERLVGNEENRYKKNSLTDEAAFFGKVIDKYNTVQQVSIDNPAAGQYLIKVIAKNTISEVNGVEYYAGYSLCACGDLASEMVAI
jgi:serine protease AprX